MDPREDRQPEPEDEVGCPAPERRHLFGPDVVAVQRLHGRGDDVVNTAIITIAMMRPEICPAMAPAARYRRGDDAPV